MTHLGGNLVRNQDTGRLNILNCLFSCPGLRFCEGFCIDSSGGWNIIFIPFPCPREDLGASCSHHPRMPRCDLIQTDHQAIQFPYLFIFWTSYGWFFWGGPWNWEMKTSRCCQKPHGQGSVWVLRFASSLNSWRLLSCSRPYPPRNTSRMLSMPNWFVRSKTHGF